MQKVFTPKLFMILVITAACLWLVKDTARYFSIVNSMGREPTPEQIEERNEVLESSYLIPLGLDLQGGSEFVLTIDREHLFRTRLERETEALRTLFAREDIRASASFSQEEGETGYIEVELIDGTDLDKATTLLNETVERGNALLAVGSIRGQLESGKLRLVPDTAEDRQQIATAIDGALKVIKRRVEGFGLTQPDIATQGEDRIRVAVPGETNPDRIRERLLKTAQLEFRLLHPQHDTIVWNFVEGGQAGAAVNQDGLNIGTGQIRDEFLEEYISPATSKITKRLKSGIEGVPSGYVIRLGSEVWIDPNTGVEIPEKAIDNLVYIVQAEAPLGGDQIYAAYPFTDPQDLNDPIKVSLQFNSKGADIFADLTSDHVGERFAIILDDLVYSAPVINDPITNGSASISGSFTQASAYDLALTLKAGAIPAPLKVIQSQTIGPSLGADSIRDSAKALMFGGVVLIILMVVIYQPAGIVALLAMTLNILIILAVLSLMRATLTLSGIGGILLTMGMAVDANVLIYERLREELESGKPLRGAINAAFGRATSVIFDANITTLLPALVLVLFEVVSGAVQGFWIALAIGLVANLFTGIIVTRTLVEAWYAQFKTFSVGKRLFKVPTWDWMKYRHAGLAFSTALTVVCIGYLAIKGPSLGIDFTGGILSNVEITAPTSQGDLVKTFQKDYPDVRVVKVVNKEQWQITLPTRSGGEDLSAEAVGRDIEAKLGAIHPGAFEVLSSVEMSSAVGREFAWTAFWMVAVAAGVILTYIAMRFQWIFGLGALMALGHDVFLALGVFKLMGHSLTLDIVSGLLIILGYSVNDTIVVFDRIREKLEDRAGQPYYDVFNLAINETLSRTIFTSGTTFIAVLSMYLFGGVGLQDFALILMLGIFFGTYSSIFVAGSLVLYWLNKRGGKSALQVKKKARIAPQKIGAG